MHRSNLVNAARQVSTIYQHYTCMSLTQRPKASYNSLHRDHRPCRHMLELDSIRCPHASNEVRVHPHCTRPLFGIPWRPSLGSLVATRSLQQIQMIGVNHVKVSYNPVHNTIYHSLRLSYLVPGYQHPNSNSAIIAFVFMSPA